MSYLDLTFAAGEIMWVDRWNAVMNETAGSAQVTGSATSASTAQVAIPTSGFTLPFYKRLTSSAVHVDMTCTFYSTVATTTVEFQVIAGGLYSTIINFTETQSNCYRTVSGSAIVSRGGSAGLTNMIGYFRRTAGTGVITVDTNCRLGLAAREVP